MSEKIKQFVVHTEEGGTATLDLEATRADVAKKTIEALTDEQKRELAEKLLKKDASLLEKKKAVVKSTPTTKKDIESKKDEIVKKLTPEEQAAIDKEQKENADIADKFAKKFNINAKDVPGLESLSHEQKLLALHSLEQNAKYNFVQAEAERMFEERKEWRGFWGKIWDKAAKNSIIESNKKEALAKASSGGMEVYGDQLKAIVENIHTTGLTATEDNKLKNKMRIEYAHGFENLTEGEQAIVTEFNRSATEFGEIPQDWAFDDRYAVSKFIAGDLSTMNQKKRYETAKADYESKKQMLLELKQQKSGHPTAINTVEDVTKVRNAQTELFRFMKDIDTKVKFNQLLAAHPDAKEQLEKIGGNWKKATSFLFKDVAGERGTLMALGFFARRGASTLMDTTGYMAIPVAIAVGGIRGWFRGDKAVREAEKQARRGIKSADEKLALIQGKFSDAIDTNEAKHPKGLVDKLETLTQKLQSTREDLDAMKQKVEELPEGEERATLLAEIKEKEKSMKSTEESLKRRLQYTELKLESGEINFGTDKESTFNKYKLSEALGIAYGAMTYQEFSNNENLKAALKEKLTSFYKATIKERSSAETKTRVNSALKGIAFGTLFAGLGIEARSALNYFGVSEAVSDAWHYVKDHLHMPGTESVSQSETLINSPVKHDDVYTQPAGPEHTGFTSDHMSFTLGKAGVPPQIERVFHEIALDHMNIPGGHLNEEVGAKSLNVAANLVKLSEGHNVGGASVKAFEAAAHFNKETGVLEIINHTKFNDVLKSLETHANLNWKMGVLQKGAVGELDHIRENTWFKISQAEGIKDIAGKPTGILGHSEIAQKDITDFGKSEMVGKIDKLHSLVRENSGNTFVEEPYLETPIGTEHAAVVKEQILETPETTENLTPEQELKLEDLQPLSPETQTKNIIAVMYDFDADPANVDAWEAIADKPVTDLIAIDSNSILDNEIEPHFEKLWAYVKILKYETGIEPTAGESIDSYIERAGKSFLVNGWKQDGWDASATKPDLTLERLSAWSRKSEAEMKFLQKVLDEGSKSEDVKSRLNYLKKIFS